MWHKKMYIDTKGAKEEILGRNNAGMKTFEDQIAKLKKKVKVGKTLINHEVLR